MAYSGKYKPQNVKKYVGDPSKVIYRSLLERRFMLFCDQNPNVLKWASEELAIPYVSPLDNRMHRYYVDFIIEVKTANNEIKTYLVEIKPDKQTKKPKSTEKKSNKTFLKEMTTWAINTKKWQAAEQFAKENNWEFKIITEKSLRNLN
jgi:hypothetical protein